MSESEQTDWQKLPVDPEPDDLGYEPLKLDITESSADGGHYVILPHDEEFLREEAFMVADKNSVHNLCDML